MSRRWDGDARSGVRMIAGARPAGAPHLRAGVEIRLTRGWHTYWRYPGDAGVPPQFNFAGSRNVKQVDVLWPAPERMVDAGGTSIGYSAGVIFPLRVVPQEAGKPVALRLRLQYAICEKLCVPAEGRSELTLASGARLAGRGADRRRRPRAEAAGLGEGGDLSIRSVRRERGDGGKERAVVDVAGPAGRRPVRGRADASNGRCRCRRRSRARRPDCSASCSSSTARPPARATRARYLTLTAVAPGRVDRGLDPSRLIRPRTLICAPAVPAGGAFAAGGMHDQKPTSNERTSIMPIKVGDNCPAPSSAS